LATSQTEATRENSLGSHQLTDVPAQYQNDSLRASRNGPKSSNRSGRNGRVGSEAGPKTLHGSSAISEATANNAEPQSRQIPKAKDTKESKQQNSSTASAKDGSKGKKKAKLSAEIGQSQFAVDIQQVPGNGIGASAEPENEDDLENAGAKRRRRRAKTPENSETIEIATSIVKMSELCKDLRTGKKSKRAEEIEKLDWTEVVRKQRERRAHREAGELPQQETEDDMLHQVREEAEVALQLQQGPQMRVVNGQMVVDDASLQVDRHAAAAKSAETFEEIEESELTRRVNSGTWLKREKTEIWSHDDISLLYQGLRMFGTDFEIIAKMFPLRSRRQIKLRYNKEERIDPVRIKQALSGKTTEMNLEEYSRLTDATYEDPAIFNAEMERKRQEHELEQNRLDEEREEEARKKREDNERSVEPEEDEGNEGSQKENDVMAANIVSAAVGKQKKTKRKAKKPAVGKVDKKSQHSRKIAGEAEVLGPVEEV
jgi:transcription factor TFIIIB component B''